MDLLSVLFVDVPTSNQSLSAMSGLGFCFWSWNGSPMHASPLGMAKHMLSEIGSQWRLSNFSIVVNVSGFNPALNLF